MLKSLIFFAGSILLHFTLAGQTAEEILCKIDDVYKTFINYTDQGECIRESYSQNKTISSFNYFLALDKKGNVYHWTNEFKSRITLGLVYKKNEQDSLGIYTRLPSNESFSSSIYEASARSGATGGGILFLMCSLFYNDFLVESSGDASFLHFYDEIRRLPDTSLWFETCFHIETKRTYLLTQDMADDGNRRRDSILALHSIPVGMPVSNEAIKPGPRTTRTNYFIRVKDYVIIRREEYMYEGEKLKSNRKLIMNPLYNVSDFENLLSKK